jgi:4-hydroxybenzoyl-CoA reductase subunit beta
MQRLAPFTLLAPATLAEAAAQLCAQPGARALAGGTDLIANLRDGLGTPPVLVDLSRIAALGCIDEDAGGLTLGAGVTLATLCADERIARATPVLAQAAATIAAPAHRASATLGGNLCLDTRCVFYNQGGWWREANGYCLKHGGSVCHVAPQGQRCHAAYSGDLAPALLALDARVVLQDAHGTRTLPLFELYADDGAAHLSLREGELVAAVVVPRQPAGAQAGYRKARVRAGVDFPLAGVAVRVVLDAGRVADLRVALTGTNSQPLLLDGLGAFAGRSVDAALLAELGKCVQRQASPMRTTVTQSNYRRQVASVLAQRLLRDLADGEDRGQSCNYS